MGSNQKTQANSNNGSVFVVVPAYNESLQIKPVLKKLVGLGYRVVVIDDCSRDGTLKQCMEMPVTTLHHVINLGQGAALQTGIEYATQNGAQYIVTFDSDGQHKAEDIQRLIDSLETHKADIALGSRFLGETVGMKKSRGLVLKAAIAFTNWATRLKLTDTHNGLRAFRATCADQLCMKQNGMAHASEILSAIAENNLKYIEVPTTVTYTEYSQNKGQSNLGAIDILFDLVLKRLLR